VKPEPRQRDDYSPQTVVVALKQRRRQVLQNEHEVERLDRVRNPSKYLGK
jgi:hypothetical protein